MIRFIAITMATVMLGLAPALAEPSDDANASTNPKVRTDSGANSGANPGLAPTPSPPKTITGPPLTKKPLVGKVPAKQLNKVD